jgi:uncharacterized protein
MRTKILLAAVLALLVQIARAAPATNELAGNWQGTLDAGGTKLRLLFRITKASGGWTATMDSVDQGARGIPVETVSLKDKTLRLEVAAVNGGYAGTFDAAGTKATGQWTQSGQSLPLILEKQSGTNVTMAVEKLSPADAAANKLAAQKVAGTWDGTLSVGPTKLRLRFHITKTAGGAATGTMDSLDQGANGIPLSAITLKDGKVHFAAPGIGGVYEGKLGAESSSLTGEWQQGGQSIPLELKQAAASSR